MRESGLVGLATVGIVLACLPRVVLHPTTTFWGATDADVLGVSWTLFHVASSLVHDGNLGIHTQMANWPDGGVIWPATPIECVLATPLTLTAGTVATFNALQVLHVGLAAAATYALALGLTGRRAAALAAAPMVALSPVLLCNAHNGNLEVSQIWFVPLAGLVAHAGERRAMLAGLVLAVAAISNIYVGISATVLAVALALARPGGWRRVARMGVTAAVLAGPVLVMAGGYTEQTGSLIQKSADVVFHMRMMEGASSLLHFVLPGAVRALDPNGRPGAYLNGYAPGIVVLLLAAGRLGQPDRLDKALLAATAVGILLALGPVLKFGAAPLAMGQRYVPLPFVLLDLVPPFSLLIELWRFEMIAQVALALLAARTLASLGGRRCIIGSATAGVLVLVEALALNPGKAVFRTDSVPDEPYAELVAGIEPGPLVNLPARQYLWPLYYQTIHHMPVDTTPERISDPALFALVTQKRWTMAELHRSLVARGYRWLVVHTRAPMKRLQPVDRIASELRAAGLVTREIGNLVLVDLNNPGPWPDTPYQSRGRRPHATAEPLQQVLDEAGKADEAPRDARGTAGETAASPTGSP